MKEIKVVLGTVKMDDGLRQAAKIQDGVILTLRKKPTLGWQRCWDQEVIRTFNVDSKIVDLATAVRVVVKTDEIFADHD